MCIILGVRKRVPAHVCTQALRENNRAVWHTLCHAPRIRNGSITCTKTKGPPALALAPYTYYICIKGPGPGLGLGVLLFFCTWEENRFVSPWRVTQSVPDTPFSPVELGWVQTCAGTRFLTPRIIHNTAHISSYYASLVFSDL